MINNNVYDNNYKIIVIIINNLYKMMNFNYVLWIMISMRFIDINLILIKNMKIYSKLFVIIVKL